MRPWLIAIFLVSTVHAERLPLTHFGSQEGLPSLSVHKMIRDSRGYIWLCTAEGVAFFDGYRINSLKELPWSTHDIVEAMFPYVEAHLARGGRLNNIVRHMLGLFHGEPGARTLSQCGLG